MYKNLSSDENFTMAASQAFDQVVASNLNFCLEPSPFSAVIHLRKSVIRNKSGTLQFPPQPLSVQLLQVQSDNYRQAQKIIKLESVINSLKSESSESGKAMKELQTKLEKEKSQVDEIRNRFSEQNCMLKDSLIQEKTALESAQKRLEIETKRFDLRVKELEDKVKDLTDRDVVFKEITLKEENKELKIKIRDSLEKAKPQNDEMYDLTRSNGIQKKIIKS